MSTIEKGFGDADRRRDKTAKRSSESDFQRPALSDIDLQPIPRQRIGVPGPTPDNAPDADGLRLAARGGRGRSTGADQGGAGFTAAASPGFQAVNEAYHPIIDQGGGLDLARYLRVLRRHKWGIAGVMLTVLLFGFLNALARTPVYRAQTTLIAEPFQRKVTVQEEFINSSASYLFYDTQFEIIQSRALAERVVDRLGLVDQARAAQQRGAAAGADQTGSAASVIQAALEWFDWRQWLRGEDATTATAPLSDAEVRNGVIAQMQNSVTVAGGKKSQIIHIFVEHQNRHEAARRANALAQAYADYGADDRSESTQRTNEWLTGQVNEIRDKLRESEKRLLDYQESHQLVDSVKQHTLADARLRDMSAKLVAAKSLRTEAELRYEQVKALKATDARRIEALDGIRDNETVMQIALDVRNAERELGELRARVTENHPDLKLMRATVVETRAALGREIAKMASSLRNDFEIADTRVRELEALLAQETEQLGVTTGTAMELVRIEREVDSNRKLYEALLGRLQETDVADDLDTNRIKILDPATAPEYPFKPNKTRIILVAAVLGLMLGIALAFLREHFDRTLKTLDDIEEKLALTALGIIPLVRERKKSNPDTQYLADPRSPFAEKINHIRTGLLFSSIDDPPRTLLITSATSGEGKTTAAINLAAAFAQLDRTLLVEVDLRKPTLRERLHAAPRKGLADLVLDPGLAREVIQPVDGADKLHLLTCGTRPANPLELLSSQQFQALLNKLQQHYRFIVLDGPPLLAVSDAAVLGHIVDETIMVAKAESTSIKMIKDASALLRKANLLPVGVILAQADSKRMAYYGGGYYHYDQRYYGEGSDSAKAGG